MEFTNSRIKEEIVECEDLIIPDLIIPEQVSGYDISIKEELSEPIIGDLHEKSVLPKGQLISKCLFGVIVSTKIAMKKL